jgi:hypothetical protein
MMKSHELVRELAELLARKPYLLQRYRIDPKFAEKAAEIQATYYLGLATLLASSLVPEEVTP